MEAPLPGLLMDSARLELQQMVVDTIALPVPTFINTVITDNYKLMHNKKAGSSGINEESMRLSYRQLPKN
jgi:hypothetical protein